MSGEIAVSIIVPVYKVERYIHKCVDSLIKQSLKNIEIILVDDESPDACGLICDEYAKKYSNVKVIHKKNEGLGYARNTGMEQVEGEYIGFVDSDDFVLPRMFEILYKNAKDYNADISYCGYKRVSSDEVVDESDNNNLDYYQGKYEIRKYLIDRIGMPPESAKDSLYGASVWKGIFKTEVIKFNNIKFVSERDLIAEDIIFDIDIIPKCESVIHSDYVGYCYRKAEESLTVNYKENRFDENVKLYFEMRSRLISMGYDSEEIFNPLTRYFLTFSRVAIIEEIKYLPQNGYQKTCQNIKAICNNVVFRDIIEKYQYMKMPIKERIFVIAEKFRFVNLLIIFVYINRWIKHE